MHATAHLPAHLAGVQQAKEAVAVHMVVWVCFVSRCLLGKPLHAAAVLPDVLIWWFPLCRPDMDPGFGPAPGGSSPVQKSKLQGEQISQLKAELKAAQDGCRTHQRLQADADRRAGEYLAQLQTRGEYILLLQSQLNDLERVNTDLRDQLASGAAAAGAGSPVATAAASSNGDHAMEQAQQQFDVVPCSQHEAVVQQLQQQLQMQTEQIQQLRQELANTALASPTTPGADVHATGGSAGSASTDDLAVHIDTTRATSASGDATSPAAAAALAALSGLQTHEVRQQQLQKQYDDLTAFVKQLEAQASQREALMGGLLAQVGCLSWA
jgi:hypothetical protein